MEERETKTVSQLLSKYKNLSAPKKSVVEQFCREVHRVLGCEMKAEGVSYNVASKTIVLRTPGPLKSEVLLRKREILAGCREGLGAKNAPKEIV